MAFENRRAAGRLLAQAADLQALADSDAIVVGITRGGMAVADEVARALRLPLDALVVHKVAQPGKKHLHVGIVVEPAHVVIHRGQLQRLGLTAEWLDEAVAHGVREVQQRGNLIRGARARADLRGRPVIVVDDSAATGATLRAAVRAVRALGARTVIVAVPVAPQAVIETLRPRVDRVVCPAVPGALIGADIYYPVAGEVSDADIRDILRRHERRLSGARAGAHIPTHRSSTR